MVEGPDKWFAMCPLCKSDRKALCRPRSGRHHEIESFASTVYRAGDGLAGELDRYGISVLHDGEHCGYCIKDQWYTDPKCTTNHGGHYVAWNHLIEWLPNHIAVVLKAHAELYPLYHRLNCLD